MRRSIKLIAAMATMLALSAFLFGCGGSQSSSIGMHPMEIEGFSLMMPDDMGSFEQSSDNESLYSSKTSDDTAIVLVTAPVDAGAYTADDLDEDFTDNTLFSGFADIQYSEYEMGNAYGASAVYNYGHATMRNKASGNATEGYVYYFLDDDGEFQYLAAIYAADSDCGLEQNIDEFISSIELDTASAAARGQSASSESSEAESSGKTAQSAKKASGAKSNDGYKLDFEYFTLNAPSSWKGKVLTSSRELDGGGYVFELAEKTSNDAFGGGKLASIFFLPKSRTDYTNWPDYEAIGVIQGVDNIEYNIVLTHPTDVQFNPSTQSAYEALSGQVDDVVSTFAAADEYNFIDKAHAKNLY